MKKACMFYADEELQKELAALKKKTIQKTGKALSDNKFYVEVVIAGVEALKNGKKQ